MQRKKERKKERKRVLSLFFGGLIKTSLFLQSEKH
jgi:hypothetical protein